MALFASLSLALALFLSGCLQSGYSSNCAQIADLAQKDQCVNYMAVWYQDPYTCYGIMNSTLKEKCFDKAVEPREAKLLQAQQDYQQPQIETVVEQKKVEQSIIANSGNGAGLGPQVKSCMETEGFGADGCVNKVAIERGDISMCEQIGSDNYRRPCISNIALASKDKAVCNALTRSDDKQLCQFYASPG
ncbi:MAG: hypothetical protein V1822_04280 [Candidatus Micrarchaeota archaeon]